METEALAWSHNHNLGIFNAITNYSCFFCDPRAEKCNCETENGFSNKELRHSFYTCFISNWLKSGFL